MAGGLCAGRLVALRCEGRMVVRPLEGRMAGRPIARPVVLITVAATDPTIQAPGLRPEQPSALPQAWQLVLLQPPVTGRRPTTIRRQSWLLPRAAMTLTRLVSTGWTVRQAEVKRRGSWI
jgi:hypothetical protein